MAEYDAAFDFIDRVNQISTKEELVAEFDRLLKGYGFLAFCVGNPVAPKLRLQERILVATWPEEWAKLWTEKNYVATDPVVYQMLAQSTPFRWRDVRERASDTGAEVMDTARAFQFYDGLGIPVRSQTREVMGITMAGERVDLSEREKACIHLAAIYFHARLEFLIGTDRGEQVKLSPKEKELLSWVAAGKTDWEAAQIMNISDTTARTYMKRIIAKLDVANRTQAITMAIHKGLIAP